jgi:ankyrin repeat protein
MISLTSFLGVSLSLFATLVNAQETKGFPDVPQTHWAYQAVLELKQKGILLGYPAVSARHPFDNALFDAIKARNQRSVKALLDKGADANARDGHGYSALTRAAETGQTAIARLLISKGAQMNVLDSSGTALMAAAEKRHLAMVRLLISQGAKVDAANEGGFTALMAACIGGDVRIVKFLIAHGANVNAQMEGEDTPMTLAEHWAHDDVIKILKQAGAKR